MSTFQVRVARKTREAEGICSYELVRLDGAPLPSFEAGAHVDVHLPNNLVRQYSLCNAPGETHRYLIGVLRDAGSRCGSRAMHDDVDTGSVLHISEPKNHFPLVAAGRTLLMAGGIGVTPILAMAESLAARGAAFEMHYCVRAPERAAFRERIGASGYAARVHFHYDSGDADQKLDRDAARGAGAGHSSLRVRSARLHRPRTGCREGAGLAGSTAARGVLRHCRGRHQRRPGLRRKAGVDGKGAHRPGGQDRDRGARGARRRHSIFLRAGRMRHVPDARAGRRARPPRPVSDGAGAGGERPVHAVLLACAHTRAGAGSVDVRCTKALRRASLFVIGLSVLPLLSNEKNHFLCRYTSPKMTMLQRRNARDLLLTI